jgi:hypothetical protein
MQILENMDQWLAEYEAGWLAHFKETGQRDFKIYNRPKNTEAPSGPGIELSKSRLALITSAGSYLSGTQAPYNAADPMGDYTIRLYPQTTPLDALAFAHDQYDHTAVDSDPQVLVPLRHLEEFAQQGVIGELAANVISFHGYMPDATRLVKETIPAILQAVRQEQADGALLIPA